jgi:hypothetical protein
MKPGAPSPVAYRCMRGWQRLGVKPPRQCTPPLGQQQPAREAVICERQCGWEARLSGKANISELLINVVNNQRAKDADRLGPKGVWLDVLSLNEDTRTLKPPAKRQGLTRTMLFVRNTVSPYFRPSRGRPTARKVDGSVGKGWSKKRRLICNRSDRGCNITSRESGLTSIGSFMTRSRGEPSKGESK